MYVNESSKYTEAWIAGMVNCGKESMRKRGNEVTMININVQWVCMYKDYGLIWLEEA